MIRDLKDFSNIVVNVKLKTGELFEKKDIPSSPGGLEGNIVSFWLGDVIRIYPLEDVEYYELMAVEE